MENLLFFGGIACVASALVLLLILIPVFRAKRKRLVRKIENGED